MDYSIYTIYVDYSMNKGKFASGFLNKKHCLPLHFLKEIDSDMSFNILEESIIFFFSDRYARNTFCLEELMYFFTMYCLFDSGLKWQINV